MNIVKEIKETLRLQDLNEKDSRLSLVKDEFEYSDSSRIADMVEGTRLLLVAALQEDDQKMRQKLFRTMDTAVACQDIGDRIDWDRLIAVLSSLGKWELEYVLDILGLSGQARYLPVLEEYTHHTDPEIREWAQEAITEIEYRVEHATVPHKEERLTA